VPKTLTSGIVHGGQFDKTGLCFFRKGPVPLPSRPVCDLALLRSGDGMKMHKYWSSHVRNVRSNHNAQPVNIVAYRAGNTRTYWSACKSASSSRTDMAIVRRRTVDIHLNAKSVDGATHFDENLAESANPK